MALKGLNIKKEKDVLLPKNKLVAKLIKNGATIIKSTSLTPAKVIFEIKWFDVE